MSIKSSRVYYFNPECLKRLVILSIEMVGIDKGLTHGLYYVSPYIPSKTRTDSMMEIEKGYYADDYAIWIPSLQKLLLMDIEQGAYRQSEQWVNARVNVNVIDRTDIPAKNIPVAEEFILHIIEKAQFIGLVACSFDVCGHKYF